MQAMFHFGPLARENAEVDGIAHTASRSDEVLAKRAFFFCADAENGVPRLLIERVGLELDTNALADIECVLEHEELRFGITGGTLPGGGDPGGSDFSFAVGDVDVHEASAADDRARGALDGGEDDGLSGVLFGEGTVHVAVEVVGRLHGIGDPAENVGKIVFGGFPEERFMVGTERFETDDTAFEGDGREG